MSSSSAGSVNNNSGEKNFAELPGEICPVCGHLQNLNVAAVSSAEAQQGEGPAAASTSGAAVSDNVAHTSSVSVVVGSDYAAAAGDFGVVAVGPNSAAAASEIGVAAVAPNGVAASCNAANGSSVAFGDETGDRKTTTSNSRKQKTRRKTAKPRKKTSAKKKS